MTLNTSPLPTTRILHRNQRGSSSPVLVDTVEGKFYVKLRGAAQGTAPLVAEVVVAGIAEAIGLAVPERRVVVIGPETPTDDRNDELADLLRASSGENLGFRFIEGAHDLRPEEFEAVDPDFAARVRWLDWLTLNPDRSPRNPNILLRGSEVWLIDHGAALPFQYAWGGVTEQSPTIPEPGSLHIFDKALDHVRRIDPILTGLVTRQVLEEVSRSIPSTFLRPLLPPDASDDTLERRRAAYGAFLWKRLKGPRKFRERRVVEPKREVPAWVRGGDSP